MKRFYKEAAIEKPDGEKNGGGFRILLDGKPVRTPGGNVLIVPSRILAETIAAEWRDQMDEIAPVSMPMLRMANTVLDGIAANRHAVVGAILRFGEHDLICYRADQPLELATLQDRSWSPMLDWLAASHGARLAAGAGLAHIPQPPEALTALRLAVEGMDEFALAALHVMASITGSLVLALALTEGKLNPAQSFQMSRIDEDYQSGKWGADEEAKARARRLARELDVAAAFLAASRG
jgi:chaperone required for assembly of F1-ATPase